MTPNRILFAVVVGVLVLLVIGMLVLSTGTSDGTEIVASLVGTVVMVGVVLLGVRVVRDQLRRR